MSYLTSLGNESASKQPSYTSSENSWGVPNTQTLSASQTLPGNWELTKHTHYLISATVVGGTATLFTDFSIDGGITFSTFPGAGFPMADGIPIFHVAVKGSRSMRVRVVAGDSDLTSVKVHTELGTFTQPNAPLINTISRSADAIVTRTDDELAVMRGKVDGQYIIPKFGQNLDVDAAEDIWNGGGDYTGFPTSAAETFEVFSSSADDTSAGTGARTVRFFYLDDDFNMFDASGNFLSFDITMNGTTAVDSGVTGTRIWRGKVLTSGSGQINAGGITCRWDTTTSAIFAVMPAGFGQTELSNFTIPDGYKGWIKRYSSSINDNTSNRAEMAIKVRDFGSNTFRLIRPFVVTTDNDVQRPLYGGEEFAAKTDLVFRATAVTNANAIITVSYGMHLERL